MASLSDDPAQWPHHILVELWERWGIREFDGGVESKEAWRLAVEDIRKRAW